MKTEIKILIVSIALFIGASHLKIIAQVDTSRVVYKAKLLTISRFGITDSISTLNTIQSQSSHLLKSNSSEFIFIKIKFDQPYDILLKQDSSNRGFSWFGHCYYYLAFSSSKGKYYRLGGFDVSDTKDFLKDVKEIEVLQLLKVEEINIKALSRSVRRNNFVNPCSSQLKSFIETYNK
ncbi:MAG TPA: hypothetical protein PLV21_00065 [Cyclobacteriaceae bacterium]|nr:hypothetical protein [Cyclobacteriaceae bacterium]HRJ80244.1 hypothetical protein [Cyclobacteriaceae bacterium]